MKRRARWCKCKVMRATAGGRDQELSAEFTPNQRLHYHHDLRAARLALKDHDDSRHFLQLKGRAPGSSTVGMSRRVTFTSVCRTSRSCRCWWLPQESRLIRSTRAFNGCKRWMPLACRKGTEKGSAGDLARQRNDALLAIGTLDGCFRQVAPGGFCYAACLFGNPGLGARAAQAQENFDEAQQAQTKPAKVKKSRAKRRRQKRRRAPL
ncbi:MAG: hypothetical protein U0175_29815 [Caldilineaceae bacterium]